MDVVFIRAKPIIKGPTYDRGAASLSKAGYNVIYLGWDKQNKYSCFENKGLYKIYRFHYKPNSKFKKVYGFLRFWFWTYNLLIKIKPKVVHVCDSSVLPPALIYKFFFFSQLVFQMYDFLSADSNFRKIKRFAAPIERFLIKLSGNVICVSEDQFNVQLKNLKLRRTLVLLNTPVDIYKNISHFKEKDNDVLNLFYGGHFHKDRGLDYLCCAVKKLEKIKLVLAGGGPYYETLKKKFSNFNSIRFLGKVSHKTILEIGSKSDLFVAFYDTNNNNFKIGLANKYFESLMLGKPLVTNIGTNTADLVHNWDTGFLVPFGEVSSLVNLFNVLKNNSNLIQLKGKKARDLYEKKYNWKYYEKKLLEFYEQIM